MIVNINGRDCDYDYASNIVEALAMRLDWDGWMMDPDHCDPVVRGWSVDRRAKSIAVVRKILGMLGDNITPEMLNADHAFQDRLGSSVSTGAVFKAMISAALAPNN